MMICYVVTETIEKYRDANPHQTKLHLAELAEAHCLVLHFSQITPELIGEIRPMAVCHSGGTTVHTEYGVLEHEGYRWLITQSEVPQIGFCGGHQIIGEMFGAEVDSMRELRDDEADLHPEYHPGLFKEWGAWPVEIVADDPIFEGLNSPIRVREAHRSEVEQLPDGFRLLASSADCEVQAMVHEEMPLYGTQFHPESRMEGYEDGRELLRNFFAIARELSE